MIVKGAAVTLFPASAVQAASVVINKDDGEAASS